MPHAWARHIRDLCRRRGIAFFFKQSAAFRTEMGTTTDGEQSREYPARKGSALTANSPILSKRQPSILARTCNSGRRLGSRLPVPIEDAPLPSLRSRQEEPRICEC